MRPYIKNKDLPYDIIGLIFKYLEPSEKMDYRTKAQAEKMYITTYKNFGYTNKHNYNYIRSNNNLPSFFPKMQYVYKGISIYLTKNGSNSLARIHFSDAGTHICGICRTRKVTYYHPYFNNDSNVYGRFCLECRHMVSTDRASKVLGIEKDEIDMENYTHIGLLKYKVLKLYNKTLDERSYEINGKAFTDSLNEFFY